MIGLETYRVSAQALADYEVTFSDDILDRASPELATCGNRTETRSRRRIAVLDESVNALYGTRIREYFEWHGLECQYVVLPPGEQHKVMETVLTVIAEFDRFGLDRRREPVISFGGGVLLDLVGVATSMYRRGVPHVRVPTTLLGQVDAAIGAKTGINHGAHKNRLGSFQQPAGVLLDRRFLASLDERHLRNGMAEIVKLAVVRDERLFELLEEHGELLIEERFQGSSPTGERVARQVLHRSVQGMLAELEPNLWERELDRLVDFGHSVGPALEMRADGELLHGETVAIDIALFTTVAASRGVLDDKAGRRILELLHRLALPTDHHLLDGDLLRRAMTDTVRHRDGRQRLPVPVGIGAATFLNDVSDEELRSALRHRRREAVPT
ncbi:sedoheptulose 7-phosphate cyclase [Actinoplanes aureus]|uniref:2-epi-5-epi-valiolone synthase n=1 Tax=Actinoplanes aureus TaxID=2792083 RepID=A0A931CFM2_9ACTN|nr:sedoheptulose 7-phosphate cyclase [Actinoplanes aureus]MBG0566348.1 sedoheptulose 7-phosphate cyclase [Actinoplanes aureus]